MKRRALLGLLVLLLGGTWAFPGSSAAATGSDGGEAAGRQDLTIVLDKEECFGSCPAYRVTIHGDGSVLYEGRAHVATEGSEEYRIPVEAVRSLVEQFDRAGFFSLEDRYEARQIEVEGEGGEKVKIPESRSFLPRVTITLRLGDREKTVEHYYMAPAEVAELEQKIDAAAGVAKYVSGEDGP